MFIFSGSANMGKYSCSLPTLCASSLIYLSFPSLGSEKDREYLLTLAIFFPAFQGMSSNPKLSERMVFHPLGGQISFPKTLMP